MKSPARWMLVGAVAWAALISGFLVYGVFTWTQSAGSGSGSGMTMHETDGSIPVAIALAPFAWVIITAAIALAASRYRSFALSVLAGVMGVILASVCALSLLAVFTPIPFIGMAFAVSAGLLLAAIFTERAGMKTAKKRRALSEMPAPDPATLAASPTGPITGPTTGPTTTWPGTPTAP